MRTRRAAGVLFLASVLIAAGKRARSGRVDPTEEHVFRLANNAPDALHGPVWLFMQSGSLGAVFLVALRPRSGAPTRVLLAGIAAWGAAKLVKPLVGRGRPSGHLADVHVRGAVQTGLGFPSGHAAVATTLAIVATPSRSIQRGAALALAVGTGVARMYVGAHLPLDVVGGVAVGAILANATN